MRENNFISLIPLVCVFLLINTTAPAQTNVDTNGVSDAICSTNAISLPLEARRRSAIDTFHHNICSDIIEIVSGFDHFFDDPSLKEENNDTRISVGLGISWSREDHASLANEVSARIALPNLQNRLQIIEDNVLQADDPGNLNNVTTAARESRPDTGLRFIFSKDSRFRFSADAGLRVGNPSEVFGKLRERYTEQLGCWEQRITQTAQWYSLDGFAEASAIRWSRMLNTEWLFQAEYEVDWDELSSGVTPSQVFSFSKDLRQTQGYRWTVSGIWPESPHTTAAVYAINYSYRILLHSNWFFMEFQPGLEFPQAYNFQPNPKFTLLFDCVFEAGD